MLFPKMASATPDTPPASEFEFDALFNYTAVGSGLWMINYENLSEEDVIKATCAITIIVYDPDGISGFTQGFLAMSYSRTQGDLYIDDVFVGSFANVHAGEPGGMDPNANQDPPVDNTQDLHWEVYDPSIVLSLPTDGVTPVNIKIKNFSVIPKPGNLQTYTTGSPRDNVPMDLSASSAVTLWFMFSRSSTQSGDWKIAFEHGTGNYSGSNQGFVFEINDEDTGSDSTYMSVVSIPLAGWGSSYHAKFDISALPKDTLCSVVLQIVRDDSGVGGAGFTFMIMWINGVRHDAAAYGSVVNQGNTKFLNSNLYRMARSNGNFPANGVLSDVVAWNDFLNEALCVTLSYRGTVTDY